VLLTINIDRLSIALIIKWVGNYLFMNAFFSFIKCGEIMKKLIGIMTVSLAALGLAACSSVSKQDAGTATGAILGGAAGSTVGHGTGKTAATIGGSVVGGILGGAIGKSMDDVDQLKLNQSLESNRTNQTTSWSNPDNHNSYSVTPTRTFTGASGEPCRDFTTKAVINGKGQTIYGTACRNSQGKWRVVSS